MYSMCTCSSTVLFSLSVDHLFNKYLSACYVLDPVLDIGNLIAKEL